MQRVNRAILYGDPRSVEEIAEEFELSRRHSRARHYVCRRSREKKLDAIAMLAVMCCVLAVAVTFALSV